MRRALAALLCIDLAMHLSEEQRQGAVYESGESSPHSKPDGSILYHVKNFFGKMARMKPWPHAPLHFFSEIGTYMVTGATLNKVSFFSSDQELDLLHDLLFELAQQYQWRLEAWAVFANHYHFIAHSSGNPASLGKMVAHLHAVSARKLNALHNASGRKIWYQYWDSHISFQSSYLARLNYVMENPVKHKLVSRSSQYRWCSASWFLQNASTAHYETVMRIKTDSLNVMDDF